MSRPFATVEEALEDIRAGHRELGEYDVDVFALPELRE